MKAYPRKSAPSSIAPPARGSFDPATFGGMADKPIDDLSPDRQERALGLLRLIRAGVTTFAADPRTASTVAALDLAAAGLIRLERDSWRGVPLLKVSAIGRNHQ